MQNHAQNKTARSTSLSNKRMGLMYLGIVEITKETNRIGRIIIILPKQVMCEYCTHISKFYCILRGRIKRFNSPITTILFEVGNFRTVAG